MPNQFHFISGLPRSGSTLLAGLLRQNPAFSAGMSSPVATLVNSMQKKMSAGEFGVFFNDQRRKHILQGIFEKYYADELSGNYPEKIIFDTNRTWTGRMSLLAELFPESRVICCVRDVGWILDSFESMREKNPLQLSRMSNIQQGNTLYDRAELLMNSSNGVIGQAWSHLREAWHGRWSHRLILVPYEHLASQPRKTMERLYQALQLPYFDHDFNNVEYGADEFDANLGMPGMHTVRRSVSFEHRPLCIPPDLFNQYADLQFWQQASVDTRAKLI